MSGLQDCRVPNNIFRGEILEKRLGLKVLDESLCADLLMNLQVNGLSECNGNCSAGLG